MQRQTDLAIEFLSAQMGKQVNKTMKDEVEISLNKAEIKEYVKRFNALDYDKKGFVSINDIRNSLEVSFSITVIKETLLNTIREMLKKIYFNFT